MRKIPTLFLRDGEDRSRVLMEVNPECAWVLAEPERVRPTRKWDGTCVFFDGSVWYARRELKPGQVPPSGFVFVDHDPVTGKTQGWVPADESFSFWRYLLEAAEAAPHPAGTYELVGPKVNGNPDRLPTHQLQPHGAVEIGPMVGLRDPLDVAEAVRTLGDLGWEGVVWWHADGRQAKLKARDLRR